MNVLNVRVDDRLVHGVVATNWVPRYKVERVICIDDESANKPILKSALRMATPNDVYLSVLTVEKAVENLKVDKYGNQKLMVVVKSPQVILHLLNEGIHFSELTLGNLGNINKEEDTVKITRYISVNDETCKVIKDIDSKGVKVVSQLVPDDDPVDFLAEMDSKLSRKG